MSNIGCILHVISVGFHHRRGATVEAAYPPFHNSAGNGAQETVDLPSKWKHLASLALPDGAHNYLKDTVYFTLSSLEKDEHAVFGIASYRQADPANFSQSAPQPSRNTVQKSLVVLTRFPLFSLIAHHLSGMAESLCEDGQFTSERLQTIHADLERSVSLVFSSPTAYQDALTFQLSAANFLRVYGRDALVCFKLLLLERRVLFDGESAGWMCNWMLTLLSLFPDLIAHGLSHAALVDPSWVADRACWMWPRSRPAIVSNPKPIVHQSNPASPNRVSLDETAPSVYPVAQLSPTMLMSSTDHAFPDAIRSSENEKVSETDAVASLASSGSSVVCNSDRADPAMGRAVSELEVGSDAVELSQLDLIDPLPVPDTPFATDHWGFPLALFTKSNLVPLYVPLGYLDFLLEWEKQGANLEGNTIFGRGRCVRGFLAGATNPLLRTLHQLADVIITTLSPNDGLADPRVNQASSSLTSVFEKNLKPLGVSSGNSEGTDKQPGNNVKPTANQSRGFSLPRRTPQVIRICPTDPAAAESRGLPVPLAQALQLSRMDRLFIDELIRTVLLWYQAKTLLLSSTTLTADTDIRELLARDDNDPNSIDRYLSGLTPAQKNIIMRFPTAAVFDTWIRQQFQSYLRALLLTADGYSPNATDFNSAYVACLQTTRCFLVWRGQLVPSKVFSVSSPKGLKEPGGIKNEMNTNQQSSATQPDDHEQSIKLIATSVDFSALHLNDIQSAETSSQALESATNSVIALLSQHPGRQYMESDDWEQLVDGFKRFGNLAADRGRRLMSQGMIGLNKLGSDINANLRGTMASNAAGGSGGGVISKFSDAFKSFLGGGTGGNTPDTNSSTS